MFDRGTKQAQKQQCFANNNDDDEVSGDAEHNDHMMFNCERFWEVPLTLEADMNATVDLCLAPAHQITLHESIFDEPSQIDVTYEEVCLFLYGISVVLCLLSLHSMVRCE